MTLFFSLLVLFLTTPPLFAEGHDLPALFDVRGVAFGDVLNIRAAPDSEAEIIGHFKPETGNIEGLEKDATGRWMMVNNVEGPGWVAVRFLARQPEREGLIDHAMQCSGTEPFWSLAIPDQGKITLQTPDGNARDFDRSSWSLSANRTDRSLLTAEGLDNTLLLTGVISRGTCSDGMSDLAYGITLDMILESNSGIDMFSGCCSLIAR